MFILCGKIFEEKGTILFNRNFGEFKSNYMGILLQHLPKCQTSNLTFYHPLFQKHFPKLEAEIGILGERTKVSYLTPAI